MPIKYTCSNGERVSQAVIDRKRSETYRELYTFNPSPGCGCGRRAEGTAHLISQKRCKDLGKTEYCWMSINMVPACNRCNMAIENISTVSPDDWFYQDLLNAAEIIDQERYIKLTQNAKSNNL